MAEDKSSKVGKDRVTSSRRDIVRRENKHESDDPAGRTMMPQWLALISCIPGSEE